MRKRGCCGIISCTSIPTFSTSNLLATFKIYEVFTFFVLVYTTFQTCAVSEAFEHLHAATDI